MAPGNCRQLTVSLFSFIIIFTAEHVDRSKVLRSRVILRGLAFHVPLNIKTPLVCDAAPYNLVDGCRPFG